MTGQAKMDLLAIRTPLEVLLLHLDTAVVARDATDVARFGFHDGLKSFGGQVEARRSMGAVSYTSAAHV